MAILRRRRSSPAKLGTINHKRSRIASFMERVSKRKTKKGCILWKGATIKHGYGGKFYWIDGEYYLAHRLAYIIEYGKFNKKLFVCHKCDNPQCVNPKHLFLGTAKDNMQDRVNKKRIPIKGNRLTPRIVKKIKNDLKNYQYYSHLIRDLAKNYNTSSSTINLIRKKMIWKNVIA